MVVVIEVPSFHLVVFVANQPKYNFHPDAGSGDWVPVPVTASVTLKFVRWMKINRLGVLRDAIPIDLAR